MTKMIQLKTILKIVHWLIILQLISSDDPSDDPAAEDIKDGEFVEIPGKKRSVDALEDDISAYDPEDDTSSDDPKDDPADDDTEDGPLVDDPEVDTSADDH